MEEHDAYERELAYDIGELRLALSSQRDSEDGQEDLSIGAPGGGGGGLQGIEIVWADQEVTYIRSSDMFIDYDPDPAGAGHLYWSLVLNVTSGSFDHDPPAFDGFTYDALEPLFEDDGDPTNPVQTLYRFRLITQGLDSEGDPINAPISMYGQYREVTTCINGEPFQRLTKVT